MCEGEGTESILEGICTSNLAILGPYLHLVLLTIQDWVEVISSVNRPAEGCTKVCRNGDPGDFLILTFDNQFLHTVNGDASGCLILIFENKFQGVCGRVDWDDNFCFHCKSNRVCPLAFGRHPTGLKNIWIFGFWISSLILTIILKSRSAVWFWKLPSGCSSTRGIRGWIGSDGEDPFFPWDL